MIMPMCAGFLTEPRRENRPLFLDILIDAKYAAGSMEAWTHLAANMLGGSRPSFFVNFVKIAPSVCCGCLPFPTRYLP